MSRILDVAKGLEILGQYENADVCAEHDVIYGGGTDFTVSAEDKKKLEELGWFIDRQTDSWARFV